MARGWGDRPCFIAPDIRWTYADLLAKANQIAHVLVDDLGVVPGNRVMLRGPNSPMLAALWFAVLNGFVALSILKRRNPGLLASKADAPAALPTSGA